MTENNENTEKYGFVPSGVSPEAFAQAVAFFGQHNVRASFCFGNKAEPDVAALDRFRKYFMVARTLGSPFLFDVRSKKIMEEMDVCRAERDKDGNITRTYKLFSFGNSFHHYGTGDHNFLLAHRDVNKDHALYSRLTSDDILEGNPGRVILVGYSPIIYNNFFKSKGVNKIVHTNGLRHGVGVTSDSFARVPLAFGEKSPSIFVNIGSPQNDFYGVMELDGDNVAFHSPFDPAKGSGRLIDKVLAQ